MKPTDEEQIDTIENKSEINERQNNNHSLKKIETEKRLRRLKHLLYSSHQVCLELLLYTFICLSFIMNVKMK